MGMGSEYESESRIRSFFDSEVYLEQRKQELIKELEYLQQRIEYAKREFERAIEQAMRDRGLLKTTLVVFDLPSEYKNMNIMYDKTAYGKITEIRVFNTDPRVYRTLRGRFYDKLHACGFRTKAGWVLIDEVRDVCVKELSLIVNELNKLAGTDRAVEIIETYMPKDYIINEVLEYVEYLRKRISEINTKIEDPEVSNRYKKQLIEEKEAKQFLISKLLSLVEQLR